MNERIKALLLNERNMFVNGVTESDNKIYIHGSEENLEKFALLIVQECLNEIQSLLDCNTQVDEFEQGVYNGLDMAKDCIKEHFGVEE
jgi:hypothetical protein